jgi:uncharacterized membrane protein YdbT with pleckstrin-like domain
MSYVTRVLQPGEVVRHQAGLHWVLYVPGVLVWVLAGVFFVLRPEEHPFLRGAATAVGWLCFAIGLLLIARAWFRWWTTEIAVTDRRVIYKKGFISRDSKEIPMDKIASVEVKQSILGRILDYGEVDISTAGAASTPFEVLDTIAAPLDLRNHITAK